MLNCTLGRTASCRGFSLDPVSDESKKGWRRCTPISPAPSISVGVYPSAAHVGTEEIGEMMYYSAVISLSDSDPGLPDLLQATFPARRLQYEAKNRSHRAWHMLEAVGESAREPLIRLLPYLRIRRRQAELALSLITLMQSDKAGSARPLSEEQQRARRLLYEQVMSLNASRPQPTHR
jgi:hypothetical protein